MFNLMPKKKSKLNSSINANSGAYTVTHDKIMRSSLNKNSEATVKSK